MKTKTKQTSEKKQSKLTGKWKATARFTRHGKMHAVPRRFVHNQGIRTIEDKRLEQKIIDSLRAGYEVRLFGGSVRLYHCVDRSYSTMYISASTLNDSRIRSCVHDIDFEFSRFGEKADKGHIKALETERRSEMENVIHVTPDTTINCPKCGTAIRVGKVLS